MTHSPSSAQSDRDRAMALYKPPFKFNCGYIFDADGHMVADDVIDGVKAARVRGWGRISYLPEPEKLQDTIGEIIADALTQYWTTRAAASAHPIGEDAANVAIGEREAMQTGLPLIDLVVALQTAYQRVTGLKLSDQAAFPMARAALTAEKLAGSKLTVWYGSMPETNGKTNWTAILHNGDIASGITLDRSEYPDRVRYEADRARWLIGELDKEPFILDYDADKHSGYIAEKVAGQEPYGYAPVHPNGNYFTRNKSTADYVGGLMPVYAAPQQPAQPVAQTLALTDFQINLLASHYWEVKEVMGARTDTFDAVGFARALLAAQPASSLAEGDKQ